jgi:DUF2934 family protein
MIEPTLKTPPTTRERSAARNSSAEGIVRTSQSVAQLGPDRELMIREAAYFRAEHRAFVPGSELEDWLAAEREVDSALARSAAPAPSVGATLSR